MEALIGRFSRLKVGPESAEPRSDSRRAQVFLNGGVLKAKLPSDAVVSLAGNGVSSPSVTDGTTTVAASTIQFPAGTVADLGGGEAAVSVVGVDEFGAVSIERTENSGPALDVTTASTKDDYDQFFNFVNGDPAGVFQGTSDGSLTITMLQNDSSLVVNTPAGANTFVIRGSGAISLSTALLPTSDPNNLGQLWLDVAGGRVLKVSGG